MTRTRDQPKATPQPPLALRWLEGRYAICRRAPASPIPEWATAGSGFVSITRTDDELSIILAELNVPNDVDGMTVESGWIALRIVGRLDFSLVGILAKLTGALAAAGVPACAVSTYDTDIVLVKAHDADRAADALAAVAQFENSLIAVQGDQK